MYDYGNARIAALRSRLLDASQLRRLATSETPDAFLTALERAEDWRAILRETAPLFSDPQAAVATAIERHRSARSRAMIGWYDGPTRRLAEALVMGLDLERLVAITRRRHGGASASAIGSSVTAGALLDVATLGAIARTSGEADLERVLVRAGVLTAAEARTLSADAGGTDQRRLEDRIVHAFDTARARRAAGRGQAARRVRAILADERAVRTAVVAELGEDGPSAAWLVERSLTLARLDRIARLGPRDPLGIGTVAGYAAAIEAQAIRLRASLARVVSGWGQDLLVPFLGAGRG
jgi:hypothetical protein